MTDSSRGQVLDGVLRRSLSAAERLILDDAGSAESLSPFLRDVVEHLSTVTDQRQVDDICYLAALAARLGQRVAASRLLDELTREERPGLRLASAHNLRGLLAAEAGDDLAAIRAFRAAIEDADGEILDVAAANAAVAFWRIGDPEAAEALVAQAGARRPADPRVQLTLASAGATIAASWNRLEQVVESAQRVRTAARAVVARYGPRDPRSVAALVELAAVEAARPAPPAGLDAAVDQVAQLSGATLGHHHPGTVILRVNQAVAGVERAQADGSDADLRSAVEALRQATRQLRAALGENHPDTLTATANLAAADLELARIGGSIDQLRAASGALADSYERIVDRHGPQHPRAQAMRENLESAGELLRSPTPDAGAGPRPLRREQLLDIWRSVTVHTRSGLAPFAARPSSDSLGDAARLLCSMVPATRVPALPVARSDETSGDAAALLVGGPGHIVAALLAFMGHYVDEDGTRLFSAPLHLRSAEPARQPVPRQRELDIVESYAASVRLCLATLEFLRLPGAGRDRPADELASLERLTRIRLSAALVGLLRSFTVEVFDADSARGHTLLRTLRTDDQLDRDILRRLRNGQAKVATRLAQLGLGIRTDVLRQLDPPHARLECGWSWGVAAAAPAVHTTEPIGRQPAGVAGTPHLYFTNLAIDAIDALTSDRTRVLGLLNQEQQRWTYALRMRADVALYYWSTMVSIVGRPPPTVGVAEPTSLLLVGMLGSDRIGNYNLDDTEFGYLDALLSQTSATARSLRIELDGAESLGGPALLREIPDLAPTLATRLFRAATTVRDPELRDRLLRHAQRVLPDPVFSPATIQPPSWYHQWQIVESLVTAADVTAATPSHNRSLTDLAVQLLAEADHRYDVTERTAGTAMSESLQALGAQLRRARQIASDRPGSATAIAMSVLAELDRLAQARDSASRAEP